MLDAQCALIEFSHLFFSGFTQMIEKNKTSPLVKPAQASKNDKDDSMQLGYIVAATAGGTALVVIMIIAVVLLVKKCVCQISWSTSACVCFKPVINQLKVKCSLFQAQYLDCLPISFTLRTVCSPSSCATLARFCGSCS